MRPKSQQAESFYEEAQSSLNVDNYDKALDYLRQAATMDQNVILDRGQNMQVQLSLI